MAYRAGERRGEGPPFHGAGGRAEHLQPGGAHRRTRGDPRLSGIRDGSDSLEPTLRRDVERARTAERRSPVAAHDADTVGRLEQHREQVEAYEAFCAEIGRKPADVAIAWLLANPGVTAPIIGPRTMEQLDSAVAVLDMTLSDEEMTRLDEIFPGPGGTAPEAYCGF